MQNPEIRITVMKTADLPSDLPPVSPDDGGFHSRDGKIFLIRGEKAYCCDDTPEGRELLAAAAGAASAPVAETAEDAIRLILKGCGKEKTDELLKRFGIRTESPCRVIVLTCGNRGGKDLYETIRSVAPMESSDLLAAFSEGMTVLIKQGESIAEAGEFALALTDTVEEETGLRLTAGIGDPRRGPEDWAEGFREACDALRIGEEFHLKGSVQVYRNQLLERLLREIPAEKRKEFRRIVMNEQTRRALNEETLETVNMFFASDLNMSDTARQMFIHRNTLTYRLDKIRKETGLDLRKFNDAAIFRVLTAMPEDRD